MSEEPNRRATSAIDHLKLSAQIPGMLQAYTRASALKLADIIGERYGEL